MTRTKFLKPFFSFLLFSLIAFIASGDDEEHERDERHEQKIYKSVTRIFHRLDKNDNGYVELDEHRDNIKKILKKLDTNEDQIITYKEVNFRKNWLGRLKKRKSKNSHMIRSLPLLENDPPVTTEKVLETVKEDFLENDENKDQKISYTEFLLVLKKETFRNLDKDGDGVITREEFIRP